MKDKVVHISSIGCILKAEVFILDGHEAQHERPLRQLTCLNAPLLQGLELASCEKVNHAVKKAKHPRAHLRRTTFDCAANGHMWCDICRRR
eukprot:SAG11_NODE_341_length_10462_cov_49.272990_12_plen_91_part_00